MKYTVCGIDRTTGLQISRTIEAPDSLAADSMASRSMVVFDIEVVETPHGQGAAWHTEAKSPRISEPVRRLAFTLCLLILAGLLGWSAHQKEVDQQRIASAAHHALASAPKLAVGPPELTRPDHSGVARPPSAPAASPHPALHSPHVGSLTPAAKTA